MRMISNALFCAALVLVPAGCAQQQAADTTTQPSGTTFEVTPAVAATTGATLVVALGIAAIVACGIACAQ